MKHFLRLAGLTVFVVLSLVATAKAVITKLTPLAEVLESEQYIFTAKVEKLDPENKQRPTAIFQRDKNLKGEAPFDRLAVNMTGDAEAQKAGDTQAMFDRLDTSRTLVFFVRKQGRLYNAKVFVEGTWFSIYGTTDADGKTVRWAFLHGEPYLRRTFKGTSAELVQIIQDCLAKKVKPPEPDEKEKPGYGPVVEKKSGCRTPHHQPLPAVQRQRLVGNRGCGLLAVIPTVVFVGPLAVIAAVFPGFFSLVAIALKRWRAFLVIASINSTLALLYWLIFSFRPQWLPAGMWVSPRFVTIYLMAIAFVGLIWAGRRYRRMAASDPTITAIPTRKELLWLLGLTGLVGACTALTAWFANWEATVDIPMREFTFIGIALLAATLYSGYRRLTRHDDTPSDTQLPMRMSLSGESVAMAVLVLCSLVTVLQTVPPPTMLTRSDDITRGDAETPIGPRLVGEPTIFEAQEDGQAQPEFGRVMSNLTLHGDRLYFGADLGLQGGRILGMNRHTGKLEWTYDAPGMYSVYCTPTIANGKLYCGEGTHFDKGCRLFCVHLGNGQDAWDEPFRTASHTEGAPTVVAGKVYFAAGDDGCYCVDAQTGAKLWQFPGGQDKGIHIDAAPAVSGDRVFVGSGLYSFVAVALEANTGREIWRTDLKYRAFGAPLCRFGKVFFGVGTGNLGSDIADYPEEGGRLDKEVGGAVVCLDASSGREEWRYPLPKGVHTGLAADAFTLYAGCRDGSVYAIDRTSGKLRWRTTIGGAVLSCPTVAEMGGYPVAVYAVSQEGLVVCLNPHTGAICWQKALPNYRWDGAATGAVTCSPTVVSTLTPTGSRRTIYIGAMTVDEVNRKRIAIFRFEDALGD
ncbi:MAG: PQQ-binding-like beta-propeller repeat protein [Gemmataceae bacterium]|nr:PQQ-binding-like beta-propeller repeat protein [Gemmata sp.]MDW8197012.1 PQQ-binding-like beta-propeller repeat protein [Gemmataceae bacterium]